MFKEGFGIKMTCIAAGYTDLRNGIDGFASIIQSRFHLDPFDEGTLFLFCGRKSDRIKGLLWEGDGFLLLYKRIEKGRFCWPGNKEELRSISKNQYELLMKGLTIDPLIHKVSYERYE